MVTSLTLDLTQFSDAQRIELLALIVSFAKPRFIPTADEQAEHEALGQAEERQSTKERAYKIDPECWVSYSGKPVGFKRAMEIRRNASLQQAEHAQE